MIGNHKILWSKNYWLSPLHDWIPEWNLKFSRETCSRQGASLNICKHYEYSDFKDEISPLAYREFYSFQRKRKSTLLICWTYHRAQPFFLSLKARGVISLKKDSFYLKFSVLQLSLTFFLWGKMKKLWYLLIFSLFPKNELFKDNWKQAFFE